MKSTVIALTFTTLSVLLGSSSPASADEAKVARGTVAAIGAKSLTVKVGDQDMTFAVDSKTLVETKGGSTKSGQAAAAAETLDHTSASCIDGRTAGRRHLHGHGRRPSRDRRSRRIPKSARSRGRQARRGERRRPAW